MRLRQLEIERFRGIKSLSWKPRGHFVCLIGPGDSRKSTILDAIELVLSPRWNVPFTDADFFELRTDEPLQIRATVGDVPKALLSDAKFGLLIRGFGDAEDLHDEPADDDDVVLTLQLTVDKTLEPTWAVVNERKPEGQRISATDREKLGCTRVGDQVGRHFSWGRGSILTKITGEHAEVGGVLAEAGRAARNAVHESKFPTLQEAATRLQRQAGTIGFRVSEGLGPRLDAASASIGSGGIALHDGKVPARSGGLGSTRLLTSALQLEAAKRGALSLIDEVEQGLEPHRLRRLLQSLRHSDGKTLPSPTLMTTHSRLVVEELPADTLAIVRSRAGETTVSPVPQDLQQLVLNCSEALLAPRIIVCEGPTEIGFCRGLDAWWAQDGQSFGLQGVALANGGGSEAPGRAKTLRGLGYDVALLVDSDAPLAPTVAELAADGIAVVQWDGGVALEQRLFLDLPWREVADLVSFSMKRLGTDSIEAAIKRQLEDSEHTAWEGSDPIGWPEHADEETLRRAIGRASLGNKKPSRPPWFKRVALAEQAFGPAVERSWDTLGDKDLGLKIVALKEWLGTDG